MKKKTIINFIVIIGLFIMSIMTLMAVYSTTPETILIFEENFESLDEKKWERDTRDCTLKNGQYNVNYESNSHVDDGVLRFEPLPIEGDGNRDFDKYKEECDLCIHENNNTEGDCFQGLSTTYTTKNSFRAKHGKVEARLKFATDKDLKASIGIVLNNATSEDEKTLEGFKIIQTVGKDYKNGSTEFKLFFGPHGNRSFVERAVTKDEFHVYEVEWGNDTIEFKIDGEKAKILELDKLRNATASTKKYTIFDQPFNLYFVVQQQENNGVEAEESLNLFKNSTNEENIMTNNSNSSSLKIDYVRVFKKPG